MQLKNEIPSRFSSFPCLNIRVIFFILDDVTLEEEGCSIVRDVLNRKRKITLSFFIVEALSRHVPTDGKVGDRE